MGNMFEQTEWYQNQLKKWGWWKDLPETVKPWYAENGRKDGKQCGTCRFFSGKKVGEQVRLRCTLNGLDRQWPRNSMACGRWEHEQKVS